VQTVADVIEQCCKRETDPYRAAEAALARIASDREMSAAYMRELALEGLIARARSFYGNARAGIMRTMLNGHGELPETMRTPNPTTRGLDAIALAQMPAKLVLAGWTYNRKEFLALTKLELLDMAKKLRGIEHGCRKRALLCERLAGRIREDLDTLGESLSLPEIENIARLVESVPPQAQGALEYDESVA